MWAPIDNTQAETASLTPWSIEQQNRWSGVTDYSSNAAFEEHMRSILPPAFRNNTAKVVWQEPKSLETNINDALGLWQGTPINQFSMEQDQSNGTSQFPPSFPASGIANSWSQPEIEQPKTWDMSPQPQSLRATAVQFCGGVSQSKIWPSEEQIWGAQRPPAFPTAPPPPAYAAGWQQNAARANLFPPPTRFTGPPFENNAVMGNWMQCPMNEPIQPPVVPPSSIPPPQRSRLQNIWGGAPTMNNTINRMYLPPPNIEYNIPNNLPQWNPSAANAASATSVSVVPKPQFGHNFVNRSSPPNTFNSYPQISKSDSFMGENAVWQDPEGEVRKWQRDTGTAVWGDPEKQQKEIKRWIVPAGKEHESPDCDSGSRVIVPLGWGILPSRSGTGGAAPTSSNSALSWPRNTQETAAGASNSGWGGSRLVSRSTRPVYSTLWELLAEHQPSPLESAWVPDTNATMPASTQQIVGQLRQAVAKGIVDVALLSKPLPNEALSEMHTLLSRIPVLDQAENDLARLMSSVKINDDADGGSRHVETPTDLMTPEQRSEYSRLVIEIAATKTEIATIRERIRGNVDAVCNRSASTLTEIQRMPPPTQPSSKLQSVVTSAPSRFGDSILDVAVRVEQQKLFSI
ncbi:unnamed protein product [Thelazia callipaeda]|uniref:Protein Gawky n=1 Tax=Thelazia callipaeda TaxID=103827 RepID=A0A0N5CQW5_THECL|nr:unnamed protein product [Thelazia callipaeda]